MLNWTGYRIFCIEKGSDKNSLGSEDDIMELVNAWNEREQGILIEHVERNLSDGSRD